MRNWTHLAFAALILACPGVLRAQEKNLPPELALVPPDSFAFAQLRPADLWSNELVVKLLKQFPEEEREQLNKLKDFLDPADVESIVIGSSTLPIMFFKGGDKKPAIKEFKSKEPPPFKEKPPSNDEKPFKEKKPSKDDDKFEVSQFRLPSPSSPTSVVAAVQPLEDLPMMPNIFLVVTLLKPCDRDKMTKLCLQTDKAEEEKYKDKSYLVNGQKFAVCFLNDKTFIAATTTTLMKKLLDRPEQAQAQGPLAAALDRAAKKRQVVVGINWMEPVAQKMKQAMLDEMTKPWRDDPIWIALPLANTRTTTLSLELSPEAGLQVQASLTFSDPQRAEEGLGALQDALTIGRVFGLGRMLFHMQRAMADGDADLPELLAMLLVRQADAALRKATVERRQATVQFQAQTKIDPDALLAQAKNLAKTATRPTGAISARAKLQSANNIKQLMLALHNQNDSYRVMAPRVICSKKDGSPLLSWRVAILPYIEEKALYDEFKLDEPWDSEHNIKLLPRMPKVFASPGIKPTEKFSTFYQAFAGKGTAFDYKADKNALWGAVGMSIPRDFTDGTSNTIGIVEAGTAVPWTKPEDVEYDDEKPLPKLGGIFGGPFHVGMMDASPRFFLGVAKEGVEPADVPRGFTSQTSLRAAILRNDGKGPGPDWR